MSDHPSTQGGFQRRPIPGFEDFYEVTRRGDVYSRRLRRFIRQREWTDGCSHIDVQIKKETFRVPVAAAIAEAFLTPEQKHDIIASVPDLGDLSLDELMGHPVLSALSDEHNVAPEAVLSVLHSERDGCRQRDAVATPSRSSPRRGSRFTRLRRWVGLG